MGACLVRYAIKVIALFLMPPFKLQSANAISNIVNIERTEDPNGQIGN